jgi:hypothetical protein
MFMSRHDFPHSGFASFIVDATDLAIHRKASEGLLVARSGHSRIANAAA